MKEQTCSQEPIIGESIIKQDSVIELFSSVQGEGKYVGVRQIFLRLTGCNMHCKFCDTDFSVSAHRECLYEQEAGSQAFETLLNPVSVELIAEKINHFLTVPHHSLSLTGGEPLLHADFIRTLAPMVKVPLFLETNGVLYKELVRVLPWIRYVSMDIKLPSLVGQTLWKEHRKFLEILVDKDYYVKIVLAKDTPKREFITACRLLASIDEQALLILQPVTAYGGVETPNPQELLAWQAVALEYLKDVRVIPQTHRTIGVL